MMNDQLHEHRIQKLEEADTKIWERVDSAIAITIDNQSDIKVLISELKAVKDTNKTIINRTWAAFLTAMGTMLAVILKTVWDK